MAGELFKAMAGVDIVHVPYKGSSGARTDVLGGQVRDDVRRGDDDEPSTHDAGKVRALATTGKTRSTVLPDVPTIAEAGVPGYEAVIWLGLMAPKGTPAAIVSRLNAEIAKIVGRPDGAAGVGEAGRGADDDDARRSSRRYLNDDIAKWARIVKISGAKAGPVTERLTRLASAVRGRRAGPGRGAAATISRGDRRRHRRHVRRGRRDEGAAAARASPAT